MDPTRYPVVSGKQVTHLHASGTQVHSAVALEGALAARGFPQQRHHARQQGQPPVQALHIGNMHGV